MDEDGLLNSLGNSNCTDPHESNSSDDFPWELFYTAFMKKLK